MYSWQHWLNHVTEYEDRYKETTNSDGTVTHTPVEGKVIQQGTPQDADNFNHMEDGISNAGETAANAGAAKTSSVDVGGGSANIPDSNISGGISDSLGSETNKSLFASLVDGVKSGLSLPI